MLNVLEGFPDDVLAVSASGKLNADDYRNIMVPQVHRILEAHGSVRMFYQLGPEWDGFTAGAGLQDMILGVEHWTDFERIAIVTDSTWIREAVCLFAPMFSKPMKVFANAEAEIAKDWIAVGDDT